MKSLKCRVLKQIMHKNIQIDNDVKRHLLIECLEEETEKYSTVFEFFRGLDARRAWALHHLSASEVRRVCDIFSVGGCDGKSCRLRDVIRMIRFSPDGPMSGKKKRLFFNAIPEGVLILLFRKMSE